MFSRYYRSEAIFGSLKPFKNDDKNDAFNFTLKDQFALKICNPANIRLDENILKTSSGRLDQDQYSRLTHTSLEDVLIKTNIFVLAIQLQDVFKTFSRRLKDVLPRCLQDIFKTSSKHFEDIFKTSSRRLQDIYLQGVLSRRLQDIFKMSSKDVFRTFSRRIIRLNCLPRSRLCEGHTSEKFMNSVEN